MRRVPVIVVVLVFLVASLLLARFLSFEGAERRAIIERLAQQPRAGGGEVEVLRVDSDTAYTLGPSRGPTRVAWRLAASDETFVQCLDVQRTGSVLSARRIIVHGVSEPIGLESSC